MALIPDKGNLIFYEQNVDLTGGGQFNTADAYDLSLYPELGTSGARAVLEVTIALVFDFQDTGTTPSLTWTGGEKTKFMSDFKTQCALAWGEKHQLTTTNARPPAKTAGVIFSIFPRDGGALGFDLGHAHWNVLCRKVASPRMSFTRPGGGSALSNGNAEWDSLDLIPDPARPLQRAAIHEFGHMLGYRDEYPPTAWDDPKLFTTSHQSVVDSIMNVGEKIYPRHYVLFADWISRQWMGKDPANCRALDWKVNGTVDRTNAGL